MVFGSNYQFGVVIGRYVAVRRAVTPPRRRRWPRACPGAPFPDREEEAGGQDTIPVTPKKLSNLFEDAPPAPEPPRSPSFTEFTEEENVLLDTLIARAL